MAESGTAAELVRALRRQGIRALCLPGIDMVALVPGEAVTPAHRKGVQAHLKELVTHLRSTGLGTDLVEDRIALDHMHGARIAWIPRCSIRRCRFMVTSIRLKT